MQIEENIKEEKEIDNNLNNDIVNNEEIDIEKSQSKFLESTLGKVINTGIDIALRAILPNVIEDEVIRNKECYNKRWL